MWNTATHQLVIVAWRVSVPLAVAPTRAARSLAPAQPLSRRIQELKYASLGETSDTLRLVDRVNTVDAHIHIDPNDWPQSTQR